MRHVLQFEAVPWHIEKMQYMQQASVMILGLKWYHLLKVNRPLRTKYSLTVFMRHITKLNVLVEVNTKERTKIDGCAVQYSIVPRNPLDPLCLERSIDIG